MRFELFIALRYLRAKRKQTLVSVISGISILGITAGVMALAIALSFSTGFKEDIQSKIIGAISAVSLLREENTPLLNYENLLRRIGSIPHITGSAPAIFNQVLIAGATKNQGAMLKGIDPAKEKEVSDFFSHIVAGDPNALGQRQQPTQAPGMPIRDNIIIGKEMARELALKIGDTMKVLYPMGKLTPFGMSYSEKKFRIAAIFESGFYDLDANWAYVGMDAARRLFSFPPGSISVIQFKTDDLENADAIAESIRLKAGPGYITTTWIQANKPLFSALKIERLALFITIGLIVFVASLNIVTTLIMMVLEKQGDIAILTAMGATAKTIQRIFLYQGLIIGLVGTIAGNILGIGASWIMNAYQLIRIDAEIYGIPYVPFHVRAWDTILVSVTAILISYLATIYPARNAAKLDPVEVLRYE